eukprot:94281-Rhodomonas_salina.2
MECNAKPASQCAHPVSPYSDRSTQKFMSVSSSPEPPPSLSRLRLHPPEPPAAVALPCTPFKHPTSCSPSSESRPPLARSPPALPSLSLLPPLCTELSCSSHRRCSYSVLRPLSAAAAAPHTHTTRPLKQVFPVAAWQPIRRAPLPSDSRRILADPSLHPRPNADGDAPAPRRSCCRPEQTTETTTTLIMTPSEPAVLTMPGGALRASGSKGVLTGHAAPGPPIRPARGPLARAGARAAPFQSAQTTTGGPRELRPGPDWYMPGKRSCLGIRRGMAGDGGAAGRSGTEL